LERRKAIMSGLAQNHTEFDQHKKRELKHAQFRLKSKVMDVSCQLARAKLMSSDRTLTNFAQFVVLH
jgi:hypothetical protein